MPPIPDRIEHRNASGQLIADAVASADGLTLRALDGAGGILAFAQVATDGGITLSSGGAVVSMTADGGLALNGNVDIQGVRLHLNLPMADPHIDGDAWNDAGTVKVSAG